MSHLDSNAAASLFRMISGPWVSQSIWAAARIGVADHLADGPRSAEDVAADLQVHPGALYRLLRALASVGVFSETEAGTFALTPMAELLRTGVPGSLRPMATMYGEAWSRAAWTELLYSLRTGRPSFDQVYGMNPFEYFQANPEAGAVFNDCMGALSGMEGGLIAAAYDFARIGTLMDVGGGHGALLATILGANPGLQGVLFDLPEVAGGAAKVLEERGVSDRCRITPGSFFEPLPGGADACIMKHILHDWDDERCVQILRRCREALPAEGRVLVCEIVLPGPNAPSFGKWLDLEMLVMTPGGRERNEEDFAALYEASGFRLTRVVPTQGEISIIEGVPV